MVKFEGAHPEIAAAIVSADIPVCGHLGLEPQTHLDKKLRGRSAAEANQLVNDAIALNKAGIAMLVLELIPEVVAARVTQAINAPTIGIGAGRYTDGQVLVITDLLGLTGASFRHNRRYAELGPLIGTAINSYVRDVRGPCLSDRSQHIRHAGRSVARLRKRRRIGSCVRPENARSLAHWKGRAEWNSSTKLHRQSFGIRPR